MKAATQKKRGGKLSSLAELMHDVYPSREPSEVAAIRVFAAWSRAVSPRIYANARPVRVRDGTLIVHVTTSSWAQELQMMHGTLFDALRRAAPESRLRNIRFIVGALPDVPARPPSEPIKPVVPLGRIPEDIACSLAAIMDDDLRRVITEAASWSF